MIRKIKRHDTVLQQNISQLPRRITSVFDHSSPVTDVAGAKAHFRVVFVRGATGPVKTG